jgi:hypothetical protein
MSSTAWRKEERASSRAGGKGPPASATEPTAANAAEVASAAGAAADAAPAAPAAVAARASGAWLSAERNAIEAATSLEEQERAGKEKAAREGDEAVREVEVEVDAAKESSSLAATAATTAAARLRRRRHQI